MTPRRTSPESNRLIAATLRAGAYLSFALIVLALVGHPLAPAGFGEALARAAVLLLMATPGMRILTAAIAFLREHDRRYAVVSLLVLAILLLTSLHALWR